jgi:hypothetical protein
VSFDLEDSRASLQAMREVITTCELLRALGALHLTLIDGLCPDVHTGVLRCTCNIDDSDWRQLVPSTIQVIEIAGELDCGSPFTRTPTPIPSAPSTTCTRPRTARCRSRGGP